MDDFVDELPPRVVPYGYKSHPMYQQWKKMLDSCTDPKCKSYAQFGAKGISVMHRWFDFKNFIEDNESKFDDEPSRPARLRKAYISRVNSRAGFNPNNLIWVTKSEAVKIQPRTICVDTVFGKGMTLKELEKLLKENAGEPLPEGAERFQGWVRVWDSTQDRMVRKYEVINTIQAIKLHELRRRHKEGLPLLAPVREYGADARLDDEREAALCAELDRNRTKIPDDAPFYVKNRGFV
jgi:hypothetical protein